jgi:hypothetical protein
MLTQLRERLASWRRDAAYDRLMKPYARCRYSLPGGYARVYHYHIRKTGGTSLNQIFLSLGGENFEELYNRLPKGPVLANGKLFIGFDKKLLSYPNYFYGFSHAPADKLNLPPGCFTVVCFRDPVQRVFSAYNQFAYYKAENVDHPCRRFSDDWIRDGFEAFLEAGEDRFIFSQLRMFSPSLNVTEAAEKARRCSFRFRTEAFEEGVGELAAMLELPLRQMHVRKHPFRAPVTDAQLSVARDLLVDEYRLLSLLFDKPASA